MLDEAAFVDTDRENIANNSQTVVKCAICQDVIEKDNISFVDLCLHQYCFDCLKQWCEVKAECPLCKQKIEKIIHSVKSPQSYKEFVPGPINTIRSRAQALRAQLEDSFDFNQRFSSDDDSDSSYTFDWNAYTPPNYSPNNVFQLLSQASRPQQRVALVRFGNFSMVNQVAAASTNTNTSSGRTVLAAISDSSDDEDDAPPNRSTDTNDEANDESNYETVIESSGDESDVEIIESQQSIISISSEGDSDADAEVNSLPIPRADNAHDFDLPDLFPDF